jgi:hypothetical protein
VQIEATTSGSTLVYVLLSFERFPFGFEVGGFKLVGVGTR